MKKTLLNWEIIQSNTKLRLNLFIIYRKIYGNETFEKYPEAEIISSNKQNSVANKIIFTSVFFGLLIFLKYKYLKHK